MGWVFLLEGLEGEQEGQVDEEAPDAGVDAEGLYGSEEAEGDDDRARGSPDHAGEDRESGEAFPVNAQHEDGGELDEELVFEDDDAEDRLVLEEDREEDGDGHEDDGGDFSKPGEVVL